MRTTSLTPAQQMILEAADNGDTLHALYERFAYSEYARNPQAAANRAAHEAQDAGLIRVEMRHPLVVPFVLTPAGETALAATR